MKQLFLLLLFCSISLFASGQKRSKTGNPYQDRKERPSTVEKRKDAKVIAKGNKAYEKSMDKVEKKLYNRRSKSRGGMNKRK